MNQQSQFSPILQATYDSDLHILEAAKHDWARKPAQDRIQILNEIKDAVMAVAEDWVAAATRAKGIPAGSPLGGEEWFAGPYALMGACNGLIATLSQMENKAFLEGIKKRPLPNGQTALRALPHSVWDRLLFSGITAEVWMQPGVTEANLKDHAAVIYDIAPEDRVGKVALILGAGNVASITPLDAFQKLFLENQVVLIKMNPVNDYLTEFLNVALKPLIDCNALRIHRGDGAAGAYLTTHALVEEIHITGARTTHDAIVWGVGEEGEKNKAANTPKNPRHITSELGAVCPTIVVPGPWSKADLRFQAENIATQKLHNSAYNCIAVQSLILPKGWDKSETLLKEIKDVIANHTQRASYYPGSDDRQAAFDANGGAVEKIGRGADTPACSFVDMAEGNTKWLAENEVFAPALSYINLEAPDPETYLITAIKWANETLYGTLGGNIIIHPATIRAIGRKRFEEIITEFRYGVVAINAWSGLAFLSEGLPWGGFPGATLQDVQSGIGTVHNAYMLEKTERAVVEAPFRPYPRNYLSFEFSLLPRPPWFVTNRQQDRIGKLLTSFLYRPSWGKLPAIFIAALRG